MRRAAPSADTLRNAERQRAALQLERTLIVSLVCVFVVVLLWTAIFIPIPRPEPLVTLPGALTFEKAPKQECQASVSVQANGTLYLADRAVTPAELTSALREMRPHHYCADVPLRLRADAAAPFSAVRAVTHAARDAGWKTITVLVEPGRGDGMPITFPVHHNTIEGPILLVALAAVIVAFAAIVRASR